MKKIHTRLKRKWRLNTKQPNHEFFSKAPRPNRPRTFGTQEAAKSWADERDISSYEIVPTKRNRRFKIIEVE